MVISAVIGCNRVQFNTAFNYYKQRHEWKYRATVRHASKLVPGRVRIKQFRFVFSINLCAKNHLVRARETYRRNKYDDVRFNRSSGR